MPVGVPKVPFQCPEDEDASWVDLYNRLYQERLLFLGQEVNTEIGNQLSALMIYLSLEDNSRDLFLFINSRGGGARSGILMYDTMTYVKPDVHTVCVGIACSTASFLLTGGTITQRLAFPHARVMLHQPASSYFDDGFMDDSYVELSEILRMREVIIDVYVQRTGKPKWIISQDIERDAFMTAEEAQAHGIVDMVSS